MTYTRIGQPTPLRDGRAKVMGALQFTADLSQTGLLHARLVTSLHPHANLKGIDVTEALATECVVAVITAKDLPNIVPTGRSRLLLARDRVIFTGQPIAVVLATTEAAAEDGAFKVRVDYEPLPAVLNMDEALAEDAPLVWPNGLPTNENSAAAAHGVVSSGVEEEKRKPSNRAGEDTYQRGDLAAGFTQAEAIVERTFTTPMVHQNSLETQSIVAQPNHLTGGMTIWSSTQAPFDVRKDVAEVLGVPEPIVRVIGMPVGGGFGGKFGLYETLVAAVARRANAAVRLTLTRSEELLATNPAPPTRIYIKAGAKRDGSLTALECRITMDDGCYPFDLAGYVGYMIGNYYRFPNFYIHGQDVLTFKPSVGAYRAPGATSAVFAIDCVMDELAEKLNLDSLKFRLQNACRPGDPLVNDKPWPSMGLTEVLEVVQSHPVWQNREAARAKGIGVGVAVGGWMGGVEPAAAVCALERDGSLNIQVGSVDMSGTLTGFALLAAETFGVASEQVRVNFADTDSAPYSGGSGGSKVTYSTGSAVILAAQEARRQALAIASDEMEVSADDLEIVDGAIRVKGVPSKSIKLSEIASKTMQFGGKYAPVFAHGRWADTTRAPAFSAQLAEVAVDQETGEVKVLRLVVAQDVGRAINPLTIQGQMAGGAIQGWGWAMSERMDYDPNGQLLQGTWLEYAMPNSDRTPSVETLIVEVPADKGPFGARGVGEAPVIPTAGAIANAIAHATGLRLTDLPMTPPRVLDALQQHSTD